MSGFAMAEFLRIKQLYRRKLKAFLLKQAERSKKHAHLTVSETGRPDQCLNAPASKEDLAPNIAVRDGTALRAGVAIALALAFSVAFFLMRNHTSIVDERVHMKQIMRFVRGKFTLDGAVTELPGYHALIALAAVLTGLHSRAAMRFYSLLIGAASVMVMYISARERDREGAELRTLQYAFFPILFPYFFLIYTDVTAVLFFLLGLWATMRRQRFLAVLAGLASVLVRQTDIVWTGLLWVLFLREDGRTFGQRLFRTWPFVLLFALFAVFVFLNKGVAIGDPTSHPFPSFHLGNVYLLLFLAFFLFLPLQLEAAPRILAHVRCHPLPALLDASLVLLLVVLTFANTHPANQIAFGFFLHNGLLSLFTSTPWMKLLFALPVTWTVFAFMAAPFQSHREKILLAFFTILFLSGSWLIEARYALLPITLFLLLRQRRSPAAEWAQVAIEVVLTAILFYGIVRGDYFV